MTSRNFIVMLVVTGAASIAGCGEGGLSGNPDAWDEDAVEVLAPDSPYDALDPGWIVPDAWDAPFDYMDIPPDYLPDPEGCGNGVVDPGEECDDGNDVDHDECTNRCLFPRCGDGSIWYGMEDCDPPGTIRPCTTSCGSTGGEWCEPYCRWTGICVPPVEICGNGADDDCDGIVDGIVRITGNVPVSVPPVGGMSAHLTWTGSRFSVLWFEYPEDPVLSQVDAWGSKVATDVPVSLDYDAYESFAWTGSSYGAVVMGEERSYFYQAFDDTGTALGTSVFIRAWASGAAEMISTFTGSSFFVLVQESNWGEHWGYMLDPDGSFILGETLLYDVEPWQMYPYALAGKGSQYAYLYSNSGLYVDELNTSGEITGSTLVDPSLDLWDPGGDAGDVAWTGTSYAIVLMNRHDLHLVVVRPDGTIIGAELISNRATTSSFGDGSPGRPRILWNGEELGLFWIDSTIGSPQITFARASEDGTVIMSRANLTKTPAPDAAVSAPSPVWTGSAYAVAWLDYDGVEEQVLFTHFNVCPR
jgi:cysteine-rich repeat protein